MRKEHNAEPFTCPYCKVAHFHTESNVKKHYTKSCPMYKPDVSLQETERKKAPNRPKTKKTRRKFPADIEDGVVIKKKKKPVSGKPLSYMLEKELENSLQTGSTSTAQRPPRYAQFRADDMPHCSYYTGTGDQGVMVKTEPGLSDDDVAVIGEPPNALICTFCDYTCSTNMVMKRHTNELHATCRQCKEIFTSKRVLLQHVKTMHSTMETPCGYCGMNFYRAQDRSVHVLEHSGGQLNEHAIDGNFRNIGIAVDQDMDEKDISMFFTENRLRFTQILDSEISRTGGVKFNLVIDAVLRKPTPLNTEVEIRPTFRSVARECIDAADLPDLLQIVEEEISGKIDRFTHEGSGWHFCKILRASVDVAHYEPLIGHRYIELPDNIKNKKATVNIKNDDNLCFAYAIIAHFAHSINSTKKLNDCDRYKAFYNHSECTATIPPSSKDLGVLCIDFGGLTFPLSMHNITTFENRNPLLSVNVYTLNEKNTVLPLRRSKNVANATHRINLLYISKYDSTHYVLIKNMSRLLNSKDGKQRFYCDLCLQPKYSKADLKQHLEDCAEYSPQRVTMPEEGKKIQFKNVKNTLPMTHVLYADLESSLLPLENIEKGVKTHLQHRHLPNSYCILTVSNVPDQQHLSLDQNHGDDIVEEFIEFLKLRSKEVQEWRMNALKIPLKADDFRKMSKKVCCLCNKPLFNTDILHRHHDHVTGKSLGYAHGSCNLNADMRYHLPLVVQNGLRYDIHLIIKALGKHVRHGMKVLADTEENYKSISWKFQCDDCRDANYNCWHYAPMRLVDSMSFLNCSLSKLVETYKKDGDFSHLYSWLTSVLTQDKVARGMTLLTQKNIYPYEMISSVAVLENTTELPDIDSFYSTLAEEGPSQSDYDTAKEVWEFFDCKTLLDYHNIYLTCDVLLLADCFENFRKACLAEQKLDPLHYVGLPGFAWDSMLHSTKIKLDLISQVDVYNFFEQSIRGGMSQVGLRAAKANNKYMKNYDSSKPTSYIFDYDVNNLYGCAMAKLLPTGDFRWMKENNLLQLEQQLKAGDLHLLDLKDSERGCTVEVTLSYPPELHDLHNDLPLAPERIVPKQEWLSAENVKLQQMYNLPRPKEPKLLAHFHNRVKYKVHWYALKLYLELGMKVIKVHRAITYEHSSWLAPWVVGNAKKRAEAISEIMMKLFKDLNNILYGKTVQKCRELLDVRLKNSWSQCRRLVAKPTYKSHTIFDENLVAVHMFNQEVVLNKPIYVGASVLDYAKAHMFSWWYICFKRVFPHARLVLTDTDSLLVYVEDEHFYEKLKPIIGEFDFSNYPPEHEVFDNETIVYRMENRKKLGKMKDVQGGDIIIHVIAIRSKMYSFLTEAEYNVKRAKGVPSKSLEKQVNHQDYCNCLYCSETTEVESSSIRNYKHDIYTIRGRKLALSSYDDKRYICDGKVDTRAFGHYLNGEPVDDDLLQECLRIINFEDYNQWYVLHVCSYFHRIKIILFKCFCCCFRFY